MLALAPVVAVALASACKQKANDRESAATTELRAAPYERGPTMHGTMHDGMHDGMHGGPHGGPHGGGPHQACPFGAGPLSHEARVAVERALAEERRAESSYAALDAKLGAASPFRHFVHAESRHAAELAALLSAHDARVPESSPTTPPTIGSRAEACRFGVSTEDANIALYDELLAETLPPDVRCVFERLQSVSRDRHRPAFESCARSQ